jgi:hypothetical protein
MAWQPYQQTFYDTLWPLAVREGQRSGLDPRLIFAQSALETGWGRSVPNNNYFGIKGPGGTQTTREFLNGAWVTIRETFRGYSSASESAAGYTDFLKSNPRYKSLLSSQGLEAQLKALGASGYATDPGYVSKLRSIIGSLPGAGSVPQSGNPISAPGGASLDPEGLVQRGLDLGRSFLDGMAASGGNPVAGALNAINEGASNIWQQIVEAARKIFADIIAQIGRALEPWISRGAVGVVGLILIVGALIIFAFQSGAVDTVASAIPAGKIAKAIT